MDGVQSFAHTHGNANTIGKSDLYRKGLYRAEAEIYESLFWGTRVLSFGGWC
jgi:hypothetical protein